MKYLMRDYIYGWHWENFKASYEHGSSIPRSERSSSLFDSPGLKKFCSNTSSVRFTE